MTRFEMGVSVKSVIDALEDHADGMQPLTRARARELADILDELADKLMSEGILG